MPKIKMEKKATIQKGSPMPCICEICSSIHALNKPERSQAEPMENSCFKPEKYEHDYQPFTNSRRKVNVTCNNFAHIRRQIMY